MKKILVVLILLGATNQLFAQEVIKEELAISVAEAVKLLEKDLKSKGLTIFTIINHTKAAKKVRLTMKPAVLVIFGNPVVGTELMNSNIEWSYELPMKIAIYEDLDGKIWAQTRLLPKDVVAPGQDKRIVGINNLLMKLVKITK